MAVVLWVVGLSGMAAGEPYDVVIRNGRIVDGTGAPWYVADIGIRDSRIARIGRLADADGQRVVNARGLTVAPGFIDMMGQTATPMFEDPRTALNLLTQGITTINAGEGGSAAPLTQSEGERNGWRTMAEYFQLLELKGLPVNVVQSVGHTQVRRIVLGDEDRAPNAEELMRMRELVREAMEAGAIGVSTALIYPPAVFAGTDEIAALAEVAGEYGGRYYTHMRNEGDRLLEAIDEAMEIGEIAGTPVHIFHLKAAGRRNWGKMQLAIARIKAARAAGQNVTADIYPYVNNGLGIAALIHPRHFRLGRAALLERLDEQELRDEIRNEMETTGGWENWFRHVGGDWGKVVIGHVAGPDYGDLAGLSVEAIASARGEDVWTTFFNLVRAGAFALPESMSDANKILAMQEPFVSFCTDVGPAGGAGSASHPRGYGSFPRLFSRYVRDLGAISLERAVAQASAAAANAVMAHDRGRITVGSAADVIVFDHESFEDKATFSNPHDTAEGMKYVLVNGHVVLDNGRFTGSRPGRVLRGPGYDPETAPWSVSTGDLDPSFAGVDRVLRSFLERHRVPGMAVAVTDGGRLVFARGYGYADVASREPVSPTSLFRIASISKPVTAVAILALVEKDRLSLDDRVFEILPFEPHLAEDASADSRHDQITLRHLLQHRGGWDRDRSFDAMFQSVRFANLLGSDPPAGTEEIIRTMSGLPLDFAPGARYAYSNYGYCLLGRVIEKVTGMPYERYVRETVLAPLGIRSMRLGRTRLAERQPEEVRYYHPDFGKSVFAADLDQRVPPPYGAWNLDAMDSHGAWIASAVDLARFAVAFDSPESCPILDATSVRAMRDRPDGAAGFEPDGSPKERYYGLGWSIAADDEGGWTMSHSGSLPGTNTFIKRRSNGRNLVVLFNTRVSPLTSRVVNALMKELEPAIDQVTEWPETDLFD